MWRFEHPAAGRRYVRLIREHRDYISRCCLRREGR
jgi:hypothetical protein